MDFVLNHWDALVNDTLNPDNGKVFSMDRETACSLISRSASEEQLVRNRLIVLVVNEGKNVDQRQLIHITQTMLVRLLDKLFQYQQHPKINEDIECIYKQISQHLEGTLQFIETFFCHYFNRHEKVPIAYLSNFVEQNKDRRELLKERMKKAKVCSGLAKILVNHFCRCSAINEAPVSYHEIAYHKEIMNALLADAYLLSEEKLLETLYYFNFNNKDYVDFLTGKLRTRIDALSSKKEKIATLHLEQKRINQQLTRKSSCLSPAEPSLREQLNLWIDEEIKFLNIELPKKPTEPVNGHADQFIHLSFKGPEIYLLHKAFVDSGGTPTETYKSLLEKTCSSISNKNQKGFSAESLKKASDKVEPVSKENVKRFLQRMIRNIDSYD